MKWTWFLLVTFSCSCFAQDGTLTERPYVMRAAKAMYDPTFGTSHVCFLVFPDGRYRMERFLESNNGLNLQAGVYQDTLPDDDLKRLQAILDDKGFEEITTPPHPGVIVRQLGPNPELQDADTESLRITVPREGGTQDLDFEHLAERTPFKKSLKPFQDFFKNLEKRKVTFATSEKQNNCEPPGVTHRESPSDNSTKDRPRP